MAKEPTFEEIFSAQRDKLCPDLNGGYNPSKLGGKAYVSGDSVEFVLPFMQSDDPNKRQLAISFFNAVVEYGRRNGGGLSEREALLGDRAIKVGEMALLEDVMGQTTLQYINIATRAA